MTEPAIKSWSWAKKIAFSLLPTVVLFSAVEAGLRLFEIPREKYLFHRFSFPPQDLIGKALVPDASLFWRLVPGYDGPWTMRKLVFTHEVKAGRDVDSEQRSLNYPDRSYYDRVTWQVNGSGFRGADHSAGSKIILLIGSSVTFGWNVGAEDSFAGILRQKLIAGGLRDWDVINAGVPGYTSHQTLVYLGQLQDRYWIGVIVFETGLNDGTWAPVRSDRDLAMLSRPLKLGGMTQKSNLYLWMYFSLKSRGSDLRTRGTPGSRGFFASSMYRPGRSRVSEAEFVENLSSARNIATRGGSRIYFYFPGLYNEYGNGEILKSVDTSEPDEIDVVEALQSLRDLRPGEYALPFDEVHLSRRGHQFVAERIWQRLLRDAVFSSESATDP